MFQTRTSCKNLGLFPQPIDGVTLDLSTPTINSVPSNIASADLQKTYNNQLGQRFSRDSTVGIGVLGMLQAGKYAFLSATPFGIIVAAYAVFTQYVVPLFTANEPPLDFSNQCDQTPAGLVLASGASFSCVGFIQKPAKGQPLLPGSFDFYLLGSNSGAPPIPGPIPPPSPVQLRRQGEVNPTIHINPDALNGTSQTVPELPSSERIQPAPSVGAPIFLRHVTELVPISEPTRVEPWADTLQQAPAAPRAPIAMPLPPSVVSELDRQIHETVVGAQPLQSMAIQASISRAARAERTEHYQPVSQSRTGFAGSSARAHAERTESSWTHNQRGRELYNAGRVHEAIVELREAVRLNSFDKTAANGLGYAYYLANDDVSAIAAFDLAIRLDSHYANALFLRSLSVRRLKLGVLASL